jgi:hypothetical protein
MLFDFHLRPIQEVQPWGEPPNQRLHWFGLTDGCYRLQVGRDLLFHYSDEIRTFWAIQYPHFSGAYVNYQVVRLWEDVLRILPDLLCPLPLELGRLLLDHESSPREWYRSAALWLDRQDDAEVERTLGDLFDMATAWLQKRHLDSAYLQPAAHIWMWSTQDAVTISWDNRGIVVEGHEVWSARRGHYSMPRGHFLDEVREFDHKLIGQMEQRINEVCAGWNRPDVAIHFESLRHEHVSRAQSLQRTLAKTPSSPDWQKILRSIHEISG